ncbi:two-component system activity regulator YycH [Heyndrickxia sporothermodurans]|uniref:Regulatory protein YycH domain-containing protein n=1 Tax=Heyndrickxia sporothermodurans TaxID=46224 RepID=A0A150L7K4_9BACI|nr:two-component system activity regulator YycH [Heyndrickxia sporothermodurans]KYD07976.1 hypothetical protein B4102_0610 [Heyndrickxia sporothermodurans]MBL5766591.1 hypothetical protein [Heyndrickxia sporothermodurans]MBL5770030.1 hypothetical protein [Heyndrickxia sporothermodurans]MBL5773707.1 hypothetical protein [Heyndrickxia sporothermodurans]MBL5777307.1 hypothetical protein [Heyndrickxia sporothermodurans]
MKYETLKTILLIFLVAISIYLTWSLWTFQVNYETIRNTETPDTENVEPKELKEIIKPMKIFLHDNDLYSGTTEETEIDRIMNEIGSFKFYEIGAAKSYRDNDWQKNIHGSKKLELYFSDLIPFDTFKGVIHVSDKKVPTEEFDQMVIDISNPAQKVASVYFINTKAKRVFSGSASYTGLQAFVNKINNKKDLYEPYHVYKLNNKKEILLPTSIQTVTRYSYLWDKNDLSIVENFKNALFPVPKIVEKSQEGSNIEYQDGTSFMRANLDRGSIDFFNPSESPGIFIRIKNLIRQSNDFVNNNGGWKDDFRYFSTDPNKNQVVFRLFKNGIPVFNTKYPDHIADATLNWGDAQIIYEYERPYINFSSLVPIDNGEVKLPSTDMVLGYLEKLDIDQQKINNLSVGYQLDYDSMRKVLNFEPIWYYEYDGKWLPLMSEDIKGEQHGLE